MKISINHSICPSLNYENFFKLARDLEISNVEIRNDLFNLNFDLKAINEISDLKEKYKINVVSINALQKFNIWNKERKDELLFLCNAAKKINCKGIVLVPLNSGKYYEEDQRLSLLKNSLNEIGFILSDYEIKESDAGYKFILDIGTQEIPAIGSITIEIRFKKGQMEGIADAASTYQLVAKDWSGIMGAFRR